MLKEKVTRTVSRKIRYEDENQNLHDISLRSTAPEENYVELAKLQAKLSGHEPRRVFLIEEKETETELSVD